MRVLISVCVGLVLFSGCSPSAPAQVGKIARQTADASMSLCREAVARSCSNVRQSLPHDLSWQSLGSNAVDTFRQQTGIDVFAEAQVSAVSRQVRHLTHQWKNAKPALTRAMATTARVELKASVTFVCATAARLPMGASPVSVC